jgi:hypothetical protein
MDGGGYQLCAPSSERYAPTFSREGRRITGAVDLLVEVLGGREGDLGDDPQGERN